MWRWVEVDEETFRRAQKWCAHKVRLYPLYGRRRTIFTDRGLRLALKVLKVPGAGVKYYVTEELYRLVKAYNFL